MPVATFKASGFKELDRKLAKLQGIAPRKKIIPILRRGANVIAREERLLVPVRTGGMRKSITVTTQPGFVLEGAGAQDVTIYIGPRRGGDGSKAHLVEFGTSHSAAEPFVRPALDARGDEAIGIVLSGLKALVDEAAR